MAQQPQANPRKQKLDELFAKLHARTESYEIQTLNELLVTLLDEHKDMLLSCDEKAFPRIQGGAAMLAHLINRINRKVNLPTQENN